MPIPARPTRRHAILAAAAIVGELDRIAEELTHSAFNDANFEPPYPTINVGRIDGGTAVNIVARHCTVYWDFRATPGADPSLVLPKLERFIAGTVLPRLQRVAPEARVVTRPRAQVPPLVDEPGGAAETLVKFLTGANQTIGVAFATGAGSGASASSPPGVRLARVRPLADWRAGRRLPR
jgi:acetylornithine deacetylase